MDDERGEYESSTTRGTPGVVPPYLLERIAALREPHLARAATAARYSLLATRADHRPATGSAAPSMHADTASASTAAIPGPRRDISDAGRTERLPGTPVRREGQPEVTDAAVNEAYDGLGSTHALYADVYHRDSIDGRGLPLSATVHYGDDYDNAFWNGERMVFGDGDGQVFRGFTSSLSVIGHELTHGVTQFSAALAYEGQSGALNEHVSDVFGALVEQYASGQDAADATWLIGAGLFTDEVSGEALRSMIHPGTAYDDDVLGTDPQPAHFADYVHTTEDNGGVHLNSGIPNRAFAVAATTLGGKAWERIGQVWYDTLTGTGTDALSPTVDFAGFAAATLQAAASRYGETSAVRAAVSAGWANVGITPATRPLTIAPS
ncbi:M4 family metallopeptidase [Plantibacter sp. Mn2098]|uniref:M4 family metallopeptidase n=1 Tax=Plantibacter sp. Mn2098 TaxID=3395266 RepID=UPI003BCFCFDD